MSSKNFLKFAQEKLEPNLTIPQFFKKLDMSRQLWYWHNKANRMPSEITLKRISDRLNLTKDKIDKLVIEWLKS